MLLLDKLVNIQLATADPLEHETLQRNHVTAEVLRLDKIHPVISGNKWFKLKYYIARALAAKCQTLITFGGAYSNHIVATAWAANSTGLKSVGIIRGERSKNLSHSLQMAEQYGMRLIFEIRSLYQNKKQAGHTSELSLEFPDAMVIEEGGSGLPGMQGSAEILGLVEKSRYSHIVCAIGTGTMFIGLANGSNLMQQITGICILKGMPDMMAICRSLMHDPEKAAYCRIHYDYHFGGYAKKSPLLFDFMNLLYKDTAIQTDFVYTGKLFYGTIDLVQKKYFPAGSRLLIIHSGGMQGNMSLPKGTLMF